MKLCSITDYFFGDPDKTLGTKTQIQVSYLVFRESRWLFLNPSGLRMAHMAFSIWRCCNLSYILLVSNRPSKTMQNTFGGDSGRVPRVPIPNTTVKPSSADGTWTEGSRESRTSPSEQLKRNHYRAIDSGFFSVISELCRATREADHISEFIILRYWIGVRPSFRLNLRIKLVASI